MQLTQVVQSMLQQVPIGQAVLLQWTAHAVSINTCSSQCAVEPHLCATGYTGALQPTWETHAEHNFPCKAPTCSPASCTRKTPNVLANQAQRIAVCLIQLPPVLHLVDTGPRHRLASAYCTHIRPSCSAAVCLIPKQRYCRVSYNITYIHNARCKTRHIVHTQGNQTPCHYPPL